MDQAERIKRLKEQAIYADYMRKKSQEENYKPMNVSYGQLQQVKAGANVIVKEESGVAEFTMRIAVKNPNTKISIGGKTRALDIDWSDKNSISQIVENRRAGYQRFHFAHNYEFVGNYIIRVVNIKDIVDLYIEYEDNEITELSMSAIGSTLETLRLNTRIVNLQLDALENLTSLIIHSPVLQSIGSFPSTKLRHLELPNAQLTEITVGHLTELRKLLIGGNRLKALNVVGLSALELVDMAHNPIEQFEIDGCVTLSYINANSCKLPKQLVSEMLTTLVAGTVNDGHLDLTDCEKPDIMTRSNLAILGSKSRRWNIIMPLR